MRPSVLLAVTSMRADDGAWRIALSMSWSSVIPLDDVHDHRIKEAGSVGRLLEKQQAHFCG
jgi:hypothetical protein